MKRALSTLDRFDLVARVEATNVLISRSQVASVLITIVTIFLAVSSTAPHRETLLMHVLAVISVVATIILWLDWRYKVYALAILCFSYALGEVVSHDHATTHTIFGWISAHSYLPLFTYWGCGLWVIAGRYAVVNRGDWKKEREQVADWLGILRNPDRKDVVEFATGSFWTGYWTLRLFNPGDCWVIAQFKRGTSKLVKGYVRRSNEVALSTLPSGKRRLEIAMGRKTKSFVETLPG